MYRCLELAKRGAGYVAPNPMVGAVLVHDDIIIGEGWHQQYGQAHAEVNCITHLADRGNLMNNTNDLISNSTLYVSLEPCAHAGKTPPCADMIIKHKIPKVVIGCRDPFPEVNGKGIEKLQAAGVEVVVGVLEKECRELNKRFFTFHEKQRPCIILKWAQTGDGYMALFELRSQPSQTLLAPQDGTLKDPAVERLLISNECTNRLVHKWRSEEAAILVGTNTALLDDPALINRLWTGPSPVRVVLDMDIRLPASLKLFDGSVKTIILNSSKQEEDGNLFYYKIEKDKNIVRQLLNALYQLNIQSVLVEGGAVLLQSFIDEGLWDEIRIIKNEELIINNGLNAPVLQQAEKVYSEKFLSDTIETYHPKKY
jgi:diaminohydroxyphosphoribosylaminopyrimidine deaminase / 5-amino-6-(5-phosphoribosylamino)uracil reductase